jgi:hypothetical protein
MAKLDIAKMSILPKLVSRFNTISTKIPSSYFINTKKPVLKFIQRVKRLRIANTTLKENQVGRLMLSDVNTTNLL